MARESGARRGPGRAAAFVLLALAAFSLALATHALAGGTPEYIGGDFTVTSGETQVITNRTLVISGDIAVQGGGVLELHNSTLLVNLSVNGSRSLMVESGGTLRALDLDGQAQTTADRSLIGSADPARRYVGHFAAGSVVRFRNSALSGFGFSLFTPGLLIESDNVTFDGSSIDAYEYLRVEGASPSFEGTQLTGDGTGSNYFFGSNSVLSNCTLARHVVALSANNGSSVTLRAALVRDSLFSFAANGSSLSVVGAVVNNSTNGVFLTNGSAAAFTDALFDEGAVSFGDNASVLSAYRSFLFRVANLAADPVRNASVVVTSAANTTLTSGNTGGVGSVGPVALLAFTMNASGRTDEPNATATAAKLSNTTSRGFSPLSEPSPVTLVIASNIDPTLSLVAPPSGTIALAGEAVSFQATAADPDSTPGGVTVSWRSSVQGPLGAGTSLTVPLLAGVHTIELEARDSQDGFRQITFNVTVEAGTLEQSSTLVGSVWYNATMWKTSRGSFALTPYNRSDGPLLGFGPSVSLHATTGVLAWSYAVVAVPYDPLLLPYGADPSNLSLIVWLDSAPAGQWVEMTGLVDTTSHVIVVSITRAQGYGSLRPLAHVIANAAPNITAPETLVAVVGQPFGYRVVAKDTPGDALTYVLPLPPAWLSIDEGTGQLSGTPGEGDRGLTEVLVLASDGTLTGSARLRIFVTGSAVNGPPRLLNPRITPASPVGSGPVTIEVTFFDPDGDFPDVLQALVDGQSNTLLPTDATDGNTTDGKHYAVTVTLSVGTHNISLRTNDGAPTHPDFVTLGVPPLAVAADSLRTLNNWFLALFVSLALTLAVYLYFRSRTPTKPVKAAPVTPEDSITFLEGAALKRIPPQPSMVKKQPSREADLAETADAAAREARGKEKDAKAKLARDSDEE